jgi:hypothetical protein
MTNIVRLVVLSIVLAALSLGSLAAQQRGGGAPPAPPVSPQAAAPIDLTGNWVSIVNEDWRWRMITPPKGDYASVQPLNPEGRKVADSWTPAMDGRCEAYGAAALMRMPTRVRITWQDDKTLKLETDAGSQTRLLRFDGQPPSAERSLQGYSVATWEVAGGRGRGGAGGPGAGPGPGAAAPGGQGPAPGAAAGAPPRFGALKVVTTNLAPAWLRRNGVPYSEQTTVTEYFDRFKSTNGDEWFFVTTIVSDPKYLQQEFVTSSHFKKEPDGSKWSPTMCKT